MGESFFHKIDIFSHKISFHHQGMINFRTTFTNFISIFTIFLLLILLIIVIINHSHDINVKKYYMISNNNNEFKKISNNVDQNSLFYNFSILFFQKDIYSKKLVQLDLTYLNLNFELINSLNPTYSRNLTVIPCDIYIQNTNYHSQYCLNDNLVLNELSDNFKASITSYLRISLSKCVNITNSSNNISLSLPKKIVCKDDNEIENYIKRLTIRYSYFELAYKISDAGLVSFHEDGNFHEYELLNQKKLESFSRLNQIDFLITNNYISLFSKINTLSTLKSKTLNPHISDKSTQIIFTFTLFLSNHVKVYHITSSVILKVLSNYGGIIFLTFLVYKLITYNCSRHIFIQTVVNEIYDVIGQDFSHKDFEKYISSRYSETIIKNFETLIKNPDKDSIDIECDKNEIIDNCESSGLRENQKEIKDYIKDSFNKNKNLQDDELNELTDIKKPKIISNRRSFKINSRLGMNESGNNAELSNKVTRFNNESTQAFQKLDENNKESKGIRAHNLLNPNDSLNQTLKKANTSRIIDSNGNFQRKTTFLKQIFKKKILDDSNNQYETEMIIKKDQQIKNLEIEPEIVLISDDKNQTLRSFKKKSDFSNFSRDFLDNITEDKNPIDKLMKISEIEKIYSFKSHERTRKLKAIIRRFNIRTNKKNNQGQSENMDSERNQLYRTGNRRRGVSSIAKPISGSSNQNFLDFNLIDYFTEMLRKNDKIDYTLYYYYKLAHDLSQTKFGNKLYLNFLDMIGIILCRYSCFRRKIKRNESGLIKSYIKKIKEKSEIYEVELNCFDEIFNLLKILGSIDELKRFKPIQFRQYQIILLDSKTYQVKNPERNRRLEFDLNNIGNLNAIEKNNSLTKLFKYSFILKKLFDEKLDWMNQKLLFHLGLQDDDLIKIRISSKTNNNYDEINGKTIEKKKDLDPQLIYKETISKFYLEKNELDIPKRKKKVRISIDSNESEIST